MYDITCVIACFAAITDGPHRLRQSLASIVDHELFIVLFLSLATCLSTQQQRIATESAEEREARLQQVRNAQDRRIATESAEEREARLHQLMVVRGGSRIDRRGCLGYIGLHCARYRARNFMCYTHFWRYFRTRTRARAHARAFEL